MRRGVRLTRDRLGIPAVWAEDMLGAMWGQGAIHARLRPLQTLLAHTAARGLLRAAIGPLPALARIDALARRLDLDGLAARAHDALDAQTKAWLEAYVDGFNATLKERGQPGLVAALRMKLPALEPAGTLRLLLLTSYLGQTEGQSRMELALIALHQQGANPALLEALFTGLIHTPSLSRAARALPNCSALETLSEMHRGAPAVPLGSNAWAAHGSRTASGHALLAGDPHLAIHELPAVLCELRARIGDNFWLGASIPGLPGLFVGRNRFVGFSGTFAFADTVDWALDESAHSAPRLREIWPGARNLAQSLAAYLRLSCARDTQEALRCVAATETLSLTFVVADRYGTLAKKQAGAAWVRAAGSSGLTPHIGAGLPFDPLLRETLPESIASVAEPFVVSANDGDVVSGQVGKAGWTLVQPPYRNQRITALLEATSVHSPSTFSAMQTDVFSLQGATLAPKLVRLMRPSHLRSALLAWDGSMRWDSCGAYAFSWAYGRALAALAPHLGGAAWLELVACTEVPLWWARALDHLLVRALACDGAHLGAIGADLRQGIAAALSPCVEQPLEVWGNVHRLEQKHTLLGSLLGAARRSRPWSGSLATIAQASVVSSPLGKVAIGAAYRFVTDLGSDELLASLPGGHDERPWDASFGCFLEEYHAGEHHRVSAPRLDEAPWH